jgi:CheY-like chemotaxis protein
MLDLNLGRGDMSGFDVARALRARSGEQPYLVAITGYPDDILPLAIDAGFDRLVCKPVGTRELNDLLASVEHALA